MDVGDRIRAARQKAGITQKQLADALGVSDVAVTLWENKRNRRGVRDDHLQKVAEVLGVSVASLLGERERNPLAVRPRTSTLIVTDAEKTLLNLFRAFPQELQLLQLAQFVECAKLRQLDQLDSHDPSAVGVAPPAGDGKTA